MTDRSVMLFDVKPGERLELAGISVEVLPKSGRVSRLRVSAPRDVAVVKARCDGDKKSAQGLREVVPSTAG